MIQQTEPTTSNRRLQVDETKKSHPPLVVKKADCGARIMTGLAWWRRRHEQTDCDPVEYEHSYLPSSQRQETILRGMNFGEAKRFPSGRGDAVR
jgi:hypothetical protein